MSGRTSRREFLRDSGAASLATALVVADPARAARRRAARPRRTVAVLGGGVAGLTAAQELAERGFAVTVYERKALGGKARSFPVPRSGAGGRLGLPAEHGARWVFGFYHHLPDTLRRIPVAGGGSVHDNLISASAPLLARDGGREGLNLTFSFVGPPDEITPDRLASELKAGLEHGTRLPPQECAFLARQLGIFASSSDERRYGELERQLWKDFIRTDQMSTEYERVSSGMLRNVAVRPDSVSARTAGNAMEALVHAAMRRGNDGDVDQVLNAPTNEAWIDPWVAHLKSLGVRFRMGHSVEGLAVRRGRIAQARVRGPGGRLRAVDADWFVCALQVERARRLWSRSVLAADPRLEAMRRLRTVWGNGIQFFLRQEVPVVRGHVLYLDSPWAVLSISQAQFWPGRDFSSQYGDGSVRDCLSATIADWEEPGIVYGKRARDCTREQIAREVWAQMKAHLEDTGDAYLPDEILHSWFLDPAIRPPGPTLARMHNDEQLFINRPGSWDDRPEARTAIPNLFLAGDYVRTNIDATSMEGANESARAAVNALLAAAGSGAEPVRMFELYRPPELEPAKRLDAERYRMGLPHVLDTPWPAT